MGIAGSLVSIALFWWLAFFTLLPIGVKSQLEHGEVVPGTVESAPVTHNLVWKALGALVIALILWGTVMAIIEYRVITFDDLTSPK